MKWLKDLEKIRSIQNENSDIKNKLKHFKGLDPKDQALVLDMDPNYTLDLIKAFHSNTVEISKIKNNR